MTQLVTLTIGKPGHSDVVLVELDNARGWLEARHGLRLNRDDAAVYLIGIGLGVLGEEGMERATPAGRGFDPTPLGEERG